MAELPKILLDTQTKVSDGLSKVGTSIKSALGITSPVPPPSSGASEGDKSVPVNPNYLVIIDQHDSDRRIVAYLPDTFNFDISSEFSTPFQESLSKSGIVDVAAKALGTSTITQQMTAQFWSGSSQVSFNLPLIFVATSGPNDITKPLSDLIAMSMPSLLDAKSRTGFLVAPGARFVLKDGTTVTKITKDGLNAVGGTLTATVGAVTDSNVVGFLQAAPSQLLDFTDKNFNLKNKISISIGRFLFFPNVVIKNVQQTFASRFDSAGNPMKVDVSITVETMMSPTAEDMADAFKGMIGNKKDAKKNEDLSIRSSSVDDDLNISNLRRTTSAEQLAEAYGKPTPKTFPPGTVPNPGSSSLRETFVGPLPSP